MTSDDIILRAMVEADYDAIVALWRNTDGVEVAEGDSRADIAGYLRRNPGLSRVAEQAGQIVGGVLCGHDGRRGLLYHLAVTPELRGQGVGRRLVEECVEGLRNGGIPRALILVAADNKQGRDFWRSVGFDEIAAQPFGIDVL